MNSLWISAALATISAMPQSTSATEEGRWSAPGWAAEQFGQTVQRAGIAGHLRVVGDLPASLNPYLTDAQGQPNPSRAGATYLDAARFLRNQKSGAVIVFSMLDCHARDEHVANWSEFLAGLRASEATREIPIIVTVDSTALAVRLGRANRMTFLVDADRRLNSLGAKLSGQVAILNPQGQLLQLPENRLPDSGRLTFSRLGRLLSNGWADRDTWDTSGAGQKIKALTEQIVRQVQIPSACTLARASEELRQQNGRTEF